ncbi:hypothetical protein BGX27_007811 [Mortierella sp. AM989]|nr:hypothetical protein BGX27_007811 [Mortierella sp. AM989]
MSDTDATQVIQPPLDKVFTLPELLEPILIDLSPCDIFSLRLVSKLLEATCTRDSLYFYKDVRSLEGLNVPERRPQLLYETDFRRHIRSLILDLKIERNAILHADPEVLVRAVALKQLAYINIDWMELNCQNQNILKIIEKQIADAAPRLLKLEFKIEDPKHTGLLERFACVDQGIETIFTSIEMPNFGHLQHFVLSVPVRWSSIVECLRLMPVLIELELLVITDKNKTEAKVDTYEFLNLRKLTVTNVVTNSVSSTLVLAFPRLQTLVTPSAAPFFPIPTEVAWMHRPVVDVPSSSLAPFPELIELSIKMDNDPHPQIAPFSPPPTLEYLKIGSNSVPCKHRTLSNPLGGPILAIRRGMRLKRLEFQVTNSEFAQGLLQHDCCQELTSLAICGGTKVFQGLLRHDGSGFGVGVFSFLNTWETKDLDDQTIKSRLPFLSNLERLHEAVLDLRGARSPLYILAFREARTSRDWLLQRSSPASSASYHGTEIHIMTVYLFGIYSPAAVVNISQV